MNSDAVLVLAILAAFVMFSGEPDLLDAIRDNVAGCKSIQPVKENER